MSADSAAAEERAAAGSEQQRGGRGLRDGVADSQVGAAGFEGETAGGGVVVGELAGLKVELGRVKAGDVRAVGAAGDGPEEVGVSGIPAGDGGGRDELDDELAHGGGV